MSGMFDAQCKCGKRFGWAGSVKDRPPCPRCGYRPDQADLEATDKAMEEMRQLLASRPEAANCRKQRIAAGLTLRQAAMLLKLTPSELSMIEMGRWDLADDVKARMAEVYQTGGE